MDGFYNPTTKYFSFKVSKEEHILRRKIHQDLLFVSFLLSCNLITSQLKNILSMQMPGSSINK